MPNINSACLTKPLNFALKTSSLAWNEVGGHVLFCFQFGNIILLSRVIYVPSRYGLHFLLVHRPNPSHK